MAAESDKLDLGIPEQFDTKETSNFLQNGEPAVKDVSNRTVNHVNNTEQRTEQERPTLNGDNDTTEENLIDLDSPGSDNFNAFLRCRLIERAKNKESCTSSVKDGDCNSITQSMHASHTESGYLTESVTSCSTVGNEQTESVSSEGDRTPCIEQIPSESDGILRNSSCKDCSCVSNNSIPSSANCDKSRPTSSSSAKALELISALDNLDELKDLDLGSEVKLKTGPRKLIDLDQIFVKCDSSELQARPESLSLPQPLQASERPHSKSDVGWSPSKASCSYKDDKNERKRSKSSGFPIPRVKEGADITGDGLSKSLPHGKIMRKGEMIEYVADDLQEMIRRSSPMSKTASSVSSRRSSLISISSNGSSTMATSVTSGMSRSPSSAYPQSPDLIPPIDPIAIVEIENQARLVADSLDLMMGNLRGNLHNMSAISVGCEEAYKTSVDVTCESVDSSIKAMYALMAKCEELSSTMQPIYKLADQIKEIKRLLDRLESQLTE